jgi:signal peptidase II
VRVDGHGFGRALVVAALALGADQASKALVRSQVGSGERVDFIAGIDFVHVANEGIAFGLLADAGTWVLAVAAVAFALLLGYFLAHGDRRGLWLPIGLLAGGALGNLIDRAREGAVTDFIDPPRWPAFNLADVEITAGVVLLFLIYLAGAENGSGRGRAEATGGAP